MEFSPGQNLLHGDSEVYYHGTIFSKSAADRYFSLLMNGIAWEHDQAYMFGRHIVTKRKVAWYADTAYTYRYSNIVKTALPWTGTLLELKLAAEQHTRTTFNSCLLNLYHSGEEGMAWHSDDEKDLEQGAPIASLTFGAERKFAFRHKTTGETVSLSLAHGSLLVMQGETQRQWKHSLPPTKRVRDARINLTFRRMVK